jgi:hypothetical protein
MEELTILKILIVSNNSIIYDDPLINKKIRYLILAKKRFLLKIKDTPHNKKKSIFFIKREFPTT